MDYIAAGGAAAGESKGRDTYRWLSEGKPMGKLNLDYMCSDISMTITENADAWDIGFLTENRLSLYHVANDRHCDVQYDWLGNLYGSGEAKTYEWEDKEAYEALSDSYGEKYRAQQEPYVKGWGSAMAL